MVKIGWYDNWGEWHDYNVGLADPNRTPPPGNPDGLLPAILGIDVNNLEARRTEQFLSNTELTPAQKIQGLIDLKLRKRPPTDLIM